MSLLSFHYILLLAVSVVVYYLLPGRAQWGWLLLVSVAFFVASCGWLMVPYLLGGILVCYAGARMIARSESAGRKKTLLLITLALVLGELACLKYLDFIPSTANIIARLFSLEWQMKTVNLAAPIGISYYTLSLVGYVLDVYWGSYGPEENPFKLALFGCWFPQMTSGPVTRFSEMRKELFAGHRFSYQRVKSGALRILWGFFKKLVIAEWFIVFVRNVHAQAGSLPGSLIVLATVCYAFYLYGDFSGCMDIILGSAELFGVTMPENFRQPFFSKTVGEFWRRWHITLGVWFKEYLLYPLLKSATFQKLKKGCKRRWGKQAAKSIPTYCGLCVLWFSIGFWHQGSWKFIIASGLIPGVYLILGDLLQPTFARLRTALRIPEKSVAYQGFCILRTFALVCFIFLFSSASSTTAAVQMLRRIVTALEPMAVLNTALLASLGLGKKKCLVLAYGLVLLGIVDVLSTKHGDVRPLLFRQKLPIRWIIYLVLIFSVLLLSPSLISGVGDFMYAQF